MRRTIAWMLLSLFPAATAHPQSGSAAMAGTSSQESKAATSVQWQITPLATTSFPGGASPILEFGEHLGLDSGGIVFWGRFGPDKNDWALHSIRDGSVRRGQAHGKFNEPDGVTKLLWPIDSVVNPKTRFLVGRRMLYSDLNTSNVYGYVDRFVKVLGKGDVVTAGDTTWSVENAWAQCIAGDGTAVIGFRAKKPRSARGWVRHDGAASSALWVTGEPVPGFPGMTFEELLGCPAFLSESTVAFLRVEGAPYKAALFRLTPGKAERLLAEGDPHPSSPGRRVKFGVLLESGVVIGNRVWAPSPDTLVTFDGSSLLFFRGGVWRSVVTGFKQLRFGDRYEDFDVIDLVFPRRGSETVLFSVLLQKGQRALPDLYVFDGSGLRPVPAAADIESLEKLSGSIFRLEHPLQVRNSPGGREGAIVTVPWAKNSAEGFDWFFDPSSEPAALTRPPLDVGAGKNVHLGNVVAWTGPDEGIVRLSDGYYRLTRRP